MPGDTPDRQWAQRRSAEAQNHNFDRYVVYKRFFFFVSFFFLFFFFPSVLNLSSLGERYRLRIIPGKNSFLVLPYNVSRSTTIGAILDPGGPARSPLTRNGHHQRDSVSSLKNGSNNNNFNSGGGRSTPGDEVAFSFALAAAVAVLVVVQVVDLEVEQKMLISCWSAVSSDEKLFGRLNEFDVSEIVSTSGKRTDGKWELDSEEAVKVLGMFAGVV